MVSPIGGLPAAKLINFKNLSFLQIYAFFFFFLLLPSRVFRLSVYAMQQAPKPEAIIEWLQKEMNYPSSSPPTPDQIRKICRGNMILIWSFLVGRVRSERTVATVRRNIQVHGGGGGAGGGGDRRGRRNPSEYSVEEAKEAAARERDAAEEEAERMRVLVRRQRRDLRAKMADLAREEADRKRVADERSNARYEVLAG